MNFLEAFPDSAADFERVMAARQAAGKTMAWLDVQLEQIPDKHSDDVFIRMIVTFSDSGVASIDCGRAKPACMRLHFERARAHLAVVH